MSAPHCSFHPSRRAQHQCETCGRWVCERCEHRTAGHVYCSRICTAKGLVRIGLVRIGRILRTPLPVPWILTALIVLAIGLLTALGHIVVQLDSMSRPATLPAATRPSPPPQVFARLERSGRGWKAVINGQPGLRILISSSSRPIDLVTLDADGRAVSPVLHPNGRTPSMTLTPVGPGIILSAEMPVATTPPTRIPLAPSPTNTPTPQSPSTPAPRRTPAPTSTPAFITWPTPAPPSTAQPCPVRSPSPVPAPHVAPMPAFITWPTPSHVTQHLHTRQPAPPDLSLVSDAGPRIALTFDGGSTADGTSKLLDLFRRLHLRVTLFLTGAFIRNNPTLVRQAVLDGHEIGNHTFTHPHLTTYAQNRRQRLRPGITREWFVSQLVRTEDLFYRTTGHHMAPLWRAPFGEENRTLRRWAFEVGYLHVRWSSLKGASLDSHDWVEDEHSSLYENPSAMLARLLSFPRLDGGIVLMHLATRRHIPPWSVLPTFLDALRSRGLQPGTVGTLLRASPRWRILLGKVETIHRMRCAKDQTPAAHSSSGGSSPSNRRAASRPHSTSRSN